MKSKPLPTRNINNTRRRNSITTQNINHLISQRRALIETSSRLKQRRLSIPHHIEERVSPMSPDVQKHPIEEQTTLELLEKIRQTAQAESIGPMPLSLQVCFQ